MPLGLQLSSGWIHGRLMGGEAMRIAEEAVTRIGESKSTVNAHNNALAVVQAAKARHNYAISLMF